MSDELKTSNEGYLRFVGEFKHLKNIGYRFGKAFANNFIRYKHESSGITIWKRGKDVEHGHFNMFKLYQFFAIDPQQVMIVGMTANRPFYRFFKFYPNKADMSTYEYQGFTEENIERYKEYLHRAEEGENSLPYHIETELASKKIIDELQELDDLGWLVPVAYQIDDEGNYYLDGKRI